MKEKKARKGKKAKVVVKDLEVKKAKGGVDSEDPKGGFDPQPEPPGRGLLAGRIGRFDKH